VSERDYLEILGIDRRIILRWDFKNWGVGVWTGLIWVKRGAGGRFCECGNEMSGFIKWREIS
jgi:hypothetical protein